MADERITCPRWAIHQLPTAIGATVVQRLCAASAKGAFERTDECPRVCRWQVHATPFAIRTHVKHQAATLATASQIRSTTSLT
ncbi:hypothetical protein SPHS6_01238 [Sphingobium sp. S6]|nr:hypothetical protein SPHS6_01238 [Sphingobium sp. S6]